MTTYVQSTSIRIPQESPIMTVSPGEGKDIYSILPWLHPWGEYYPLQWIETVMGGSGPEPLSSIPVNLINCDQAIKTSTPDQHSILGGGGAYLPLLVTRTAYCISHIMHTAYHISYICTLYHTFCLLYITHPKYYNFYNPHTYYISRTLHM